MNGALIIDKPEGITSHDAVARIRRAAGTRRVGHAGTLDPFATGVLVVCLGQATRLMQFLVGLDKEYIATVRIGFATDTQDVTGKQITPLRTSKELSLEEITSALNQFVGRQLQTPPMYSAKKVGGERLYKAAREGREIERQPAEIEIYSINLETSDGDWFRENEDGSRDFVISVRCSSGTYIRTLANDLGERLGVGAHLAALRRTAVGHFEISRAITLEELESLAPERLSEAIISPADTIAHLPATHLNSDDARMVANGRAIELKEEIEGFVIRLLDEKGNLLAVGEIDSERRVIKPRIVLMREV
ncbi:MAG TPA: tRNA pseudouridine(55) synthase TruB [Blastocatellia bacterium]|jgi:tRNA pseudouridine55 synthase